MLVSGAIVSPDSMVVQPEVGVVPLLVENTYSNVLSCELASCASTTRVGFALS